MRTEMLTMSAIFGIAGLFVEPVYIRDWWQPLTIFGTSIGLEDFLFGALIGGISAVSYEVIFKRRLYPRKSRSRERTFYESYLFLGSIMLCGALFYATFLAGFSSFISSLVALSIATLLIWFHREDLIVDSLASGFLLVFFGLSWFGIAECITPGWVEKYWLHANLSNVIILNAPLEDIVWGFLAGTYIGPLYEFWKEGKLVPLRKRK